LVVPRGPVLCLYCHKVIVNPCPRQHLHSGCRNSHENRIRRRRYAARRAQERAS
jgi:hypothetical protein